jgi:hypothetical protein
MTVRTAANKWIDRQMDRWTVGNMKKRKDRKSMDRWTDRWKDRQMNGQTDGWTDK